MNGPTWRHALLLLAFVLLLGLAGQSDVNADGVPRNPEGWPSRIRVFLIHHRGSSVPARVVTVPFDEYVETVMASGAWPAHKPMESLKAGAAVIAARALWMIRHPQPGYRWRGQRYDIHNGSVRAGLRGTGADAGQLYRHGTRVHSRIRRAVAAIHGAQLRRGARLAKPQWHALGGRCGQVTTGNRLYEDGATDCARRGYSWLRILRVYLPNVRVVR
jgi:hypothetical protein